MHGLVSPALLTSWPLEALILSPESPPTACFTASLLAALCTVPPLMPFGDLCDFLNERNVIIFCRPKLASQGFRPMKARPFLASLLVPICSGLWGPRSLTMAFSRRFLACRTLGVPSEHGPLLSHLKVLWVAGDREWQDEEPELERLREQSRRLALLGGLW